LKISYVCLAITKTAKENYCSTEAFHTGNYTEIVPQTKKPQRMWRLIV